jgi:hypothetical protein
MLIGRNELTKHKTPQKQKNKTKNPNEKRCQEDCCVISFKVLTWSVKNHNISQNVTIEETHAIRANYNIVKTSQASQEHVLLRLKYLIIPNVNSLIYRPNICIQ